MPTTLHCRACSTLALLMLASQGGVARAQVQGPSSSRTPYLVSTAPSGVVHNITSIVTTTNLVPLTGAPASTFEFCGLPDGLGAFDNGNGTVTILCNHEITNTLGAIRRHGARGAFVTELIVDKNTLAVVSGSDLIQHVIDGSGVVHDGANSNALAFNRFCSADLPPDSAFYNAASGLGTQERIFMHAEESGTNGWQQATVVTGPARGNSYTLPEFNLSTNGSGLTGVGARENALANPLPQDLTIVMGNNDGGTGIMNDSVAVYVGTKQSTGTVVDRAGLTNGSLYFVNVAGNPAEIANTTTRATNITNGTPFFLSGTASTTFSRPEDGSWNPLNPNQYFFATTDRLDTATSSGTNQTIGATGATNQSGKSRLWRLTFTDITNPTLGGVIDLLIDGSKAGQKVNMLDNMTVAPNGRIYLNEDPGNSTYIGKVWAYDVATNTLVQLARFDPARWGELAVNGGTPGAISPWVNNKESSGVIDVTSLFPHAADEVVLLMVAQDHSSNAAVANATTVEGGQLMLFRVALGARATAFGSGCGLSLGGAALPVLGSTLLADVGSVPSGSPAFMMVGDSNATWFGIPLPIVLDPIGLTGCLLHQNIALEAVGTCAATSPNTARYSLPIPSVHTLVGATIYLQAWAPSALANPGGLITSNALTVVLGL